MGPYWCLTVTAPEGTEGGYARIQKDYGVREQLKRVDKSVVKVKPTPLKAKVWHSWEGDFSGRLVERVGVDRRNYLAMWVQPKVLYIPRAKSFPFSAVRVAFWRKTKKKRKGSAELLCAWERNVREGN
jgi:hypothetical protein